jgi:hypothetical protein
MTKEVSYQILDGSNCRELEPNCYRVHLKSHIGWRVYPIEVCDRLEQLKYSEPLIHIVPSLRLQEFVVVLCSWAAPLVVRTSIGSSIRPLRKQELVTSTTINGAAPSFVVEEFFINSKRSKAGIILDD